MRPEIAAGHYAPSRGSLLVFVFGFGVVSASKDVCDTDEKLLQGRGNLFLQASSRLVGQARQSALPLEIASDHANENLTFATAKLGAREEERLQEIGCEANRGIGTTAGITEAGYAQVAETCCQNEMEVFIHRVIANLGMQVCLEGGPTAAAPYHSCQEGPQNLAALTNDILRSMVTSNTTSCGWVQKADLPCPPMDYFTNGCIGISKVDQKDKTIVSSHRRRSCGLGRSGGPITTGVMEFILPDPVKFMKSSDVRRIIARAIAQALSISEARVIATAHVAYIHSKPKVTKVGVIGRFAVVDPYGQLNGTDLAVTLKSIDLAVVASRLKKNGADHARVLRMRVYEPASPNAPTEMCSPYVPGEPGAPWTPKEIRYVREKLNQALGMAKGWIKQLNTMKDVSWHDIPSTAKIIRLAFHACMPYTDGSGGCDGCVHWDGVGSRVPRKSLRKFKLPSMGVTNNNALGYTVELLEEIYTNPDFPQGSPQLETSLQNCGKSRADLWAFAGIVAVERAIELTNLACADPSNKKIKRRKQCVRNAGDPSCFIDYDTRPLTFMTGRRDCVKHKEKPFMSVNEDRQPDPHDNGRKTVEYFRDNFGLQAKETVALMGVHTYGRKHFSHSLFRYTWTNRNDRLFTNDYFKNMVLKREWFYPSDGDECVERGDAWGQKPAARWVAHAFADTVDGTPVMWIQEKLICAEDCSQVTPLKPSKCCTDLPVGAKCRPDNARGQGSSMPEADDDTNSGCEAFSSAIGNDEAMLNSDMGLYYDFETRDGGIPYGCANLENFNLTMFRKGYKYQRSGSHSTKKWRADAKCSLNAYAEPAGSTPLYQIVEEFAENQQSWIDNFIPAYEKMLANGYQPGELRVNS